MTERTGPGVAAALHPGATEPGMIPWTHGVRDGWALAIETLRDGATHERCPDEECDHRSEWECAAATLEAMAPYRPWPSVYEPEPDPPGSPGDLATFRRDFFVDLGGVEDETLRAAMAEAPDLVDSARHWGWADTEVRDRFAAHLRARGIDVD